jgi:hypothetical protein
VQAPEGGKRKGTAAADSQPKRFDLQELIVSSGWGFSKNDYSIKHHSDDRPIHGGSDRSNCPSCNTVNRALSVSWL